MIKNYYKGKFVFKSAKLAAHALLLYNKLEHWTKKANKHLRKYFNKKFKWGQSSEKPMPQSNGRIQVTIKPVELFQSLKLLYPRHLWTIVPITQLS